MQIQHLAPQSAIGNVGWARLGWHWGKMERRRLGASCDKQSCDTGAYGGGY